MVAPLQTTFWSAFFQWKILILFEILLEFVDKSSIDNMLLW